MFKQWNGWVVRINNTTRRAKHYFHFALAILFSLIYAFQIALGLMIAFSWTESCSLSPRHRTCCCFHKSFCWKFCGMEVLIDISNYSEVIFCWMSGVYFDQLGSSIIFCIYYHSLRTSSVRIRDSWNKGLSKRYACTFWYWLLNLWWILLGCSFWPVYVGIDTHGILLFRTLIGKVWLHI